MIGAFGTHNNYNNSYYPGALPGIGRGRRRIGQATPAPVNINNISSVVGEDLFFPAGSNAQILTYPSADPNAVSLGGASSNPAATVPTDSGMNITGVVNDSNGNPWFKAIDTLGVTTSVGGTVYIPAVQASIPTASAAQGGIPILTIDGTGGTQAYSGSGPASAPAANTPGAGATQQPGTGTTPTVAPGAGGSGGGGGGGGSWLSLNSNFGPGTNGESILFWVLIAGLGVVTVDQISKR